MSKKLGFALSGLMLAMVAGTASADMDGGQLNISGLVVDNTCETRVDGGNKDGLILLQTATVGEIDAGVLNDTVGAKAKPFSITVDCSKANPNPGSTAKMTFGSVFFGNSKGTLNNDMSINNPSDGVNIALHNIDGPLSNRFKLTTLAMCILKPWMQRQNLLFMILKRLTFVPSQTKQQLLVM